MNFKNSNCVMLAKWQSRQLETLVPLAGTMRRKQKLSESTLSKLWKIAKAYKGMLHQKKRQLDETTFLVQWLRRFPPNAKAQVCFLLWASLVAQLVKNPPANTGGPGSIPGLGRSPGEGKGYPLQCSGLENSMDYIYVEISFSVFFFKAPGMRKSDIY